MTNSGFEKFGQSGYLSQTKVSPLVSFLEKGIIAGTRCKNCGKLYFPPRADCLECRKSEIEWVPIQGKARLVSFTEVYFAPPAFQQATPYLLGLAEFDNGLRVFAPISRDISRLDLKLDIELVLTSRKTGEGVYYQLDTPD